MKYESEILYDLMKRDGLLNPSQDNLPYESELKEKYVNDVEGAYPKLNDYRAEWLNYNKCEYIPADFPTEAQTNQTSGTFQNVIPFAYDVATLKGQTLVNIVNNGNWEETGTNLFSQNIRIKKGQIYTVMGKTEASDCILNSSTSENTPAFRICAGTNSNGTSLFFIQKSDKVFKATFTNNENDTIHLRYYNQKTNYKKLLIIEGDHTQEDIPYFEGMKSVQMPVLTTTGKNLLNTNIFGCKQSDGTLKPAYTPNAATLGNIVLKPNTKYVLSVTYNNSNTTNSQMYFPRIRTNNGNYILSMVIGTSTTNYSMAFTTTDEINYVIDVSANNGDTKGLYIITSIQIEQGSTSTTYEPYKSITASADVTLRGLEVVKDELNLKTREMTTNIKEYTITGNEDWGENKEENCQRFRIILSDIITENINDYKIYVVSEKLLGVKWNNCWSTQYTISTIGGIIYMHFPLGTTMQQAKQLMVGSKIQYAIKTPVINKIDLTIIDEDNAKCDLAPIMDTMHYEASSDTIPPLADLTVCVEATTQNLASFVHLEGVGENE